MENTNIYSDKLSGKELLQLCTHCTVEAIECLFPEINEQMDLQYDSMLKSYFQKGFIATYTIHLQTINTLDKCSISIEYKSTTKNNYKIKYVIMNIIVPHYMLNNYIKTLKENDVFILGDCEESIEKLFIPQNIISSEDGTKSILFNISLVYNERSKKEIVHLATA